ncbi:hypothetical protein ONS95_002681 [Cadophora gregata]|uniref:uncharacterized protein n=1 Tax=Cadophora gregata TaxID=51156 RepID=UPI0026DA7FBC|nr:uncharacterized protein ONS95_002681 [Cadophora gregata]KAK0110020.1 hypothetical protein ONS95_002681 [Cadophora gregata]KAK0110357.1 hypothetical protein ONS96_001973 [Cadophora gregata f. sp. sojae]
MLPVMAPFRLNTTTRDVLDRSSSSEEVDYAPIQLPPVTNLSRLDPDCTQPSTLANMPSQSFTPSNRMPAKRLNSLQQRLKAARKANYELTLQVANIEHQLYTEWDSLSFGSESARNRHTELAMEQKEWYRELRNVHKQRIQHLEMEIQKESDYMNWRDWSPVELLIRWKSGNMDYSIFKDHEATYRVQNAFKLEAGLKPPRLKVIALVSTQVAAGWYKVPTQSIDWENRIPIPGYVDKDFSEDGRHDTNLHAIQHEPRDEFVMRGNSIQMDGQYRTGPQRNLVRKFDGNVEPRPSSRESRYKEKVDDWHWEMEPGTESFIRMEDQELQNRNQGYIDAGSRQRTRLGVDLDLQLDDESFPIPDDHSHSRPSWANNYPNYEYSQEVLDDITAKAYAPEKPKKIVPMIAGRPFSRPIVAREYVS